MTHFDEPLFVIGSDGHVRPLNDIVTEVIDRALASEGSVTGAAIGLGVGRTTIYRHLQHRGRERHD